jgi:hypothetical protein
MHIAERDRKAADDEVNHGSTQVLVSPIEVRVDQEAWTRKPDARSIIRRRGGQFFDDVERLAVDHPDLVQRVEQVERFQDRHITPSIARFRWAPHRPSALPEDRQWRLYRPNAIIQMV